MLNNELFTQALNLEKPWYVREVKFDPSVKRLDVCMGRTPELSPCPVGGKPFVDYDSMEREWSHLDFFQYEFYIHTRIPRTICKEHGVRTLNVPWTRKDLNFLKMFEYHAPDFSRDIPVSSASRFFNTDQDSVRRILKHYVVDARSGMTLSCTKNIRVDEIDIMRGHNYETISYDHTKRRVIHAGMGMKNMVFRRLKRMLPKPRKVKNFAMDMTKPYILGSGKYFPKFR